MGNGEGANLNRALRGWANYFQEDAMSKFLRYMLTVVVTIDLSVAQAAEFATLTQGQTVPDGVIKIGRFQLQLPPGTWTVAAAVELRQGSQAGGVTTTPMQLGLAVAQVEKKKAKALLIFRTPANTFVGVNRWNDDPCAEITDALVKDTMKQTFAMPECFAVVPFSPRSFVSGTGPVFGEISKWLKSAQVDLPDSLLRVYYSKYHGGDFFHANVYLPGKRDNYAPAEAWGRDAAAAMQGMVTGARAVAVLPAVPPLVLPEDFAARRAAALAEKEAALRRAEAEKGAAEAAAADPTAERSTAQQAASQARADQPVIPPRAAAGAIPAPTPKPKAAPVQIGSEKPKPAPSKPKSSLDL